MRRNDVFLESVLKNYLIVKEIKINLTKKYTQSIENKLKFSLTPQEYIILDQILLGTKINNIALNLNVTKRNIEKYITRLLDKSQTKDIRELKSLYWYSKKSNSRANDGNRTRESWNHNPLP